VCSIFINVTVKGHTLSPYSKTQHTQTDFVYMAQLTEKLAQEWLCMRYGYIAKTDKYSGLDGKKC